MRARRRRRALSARSISTAIISKERVALRRQMCRSHVRRARRKRLSMRARRRRAVRAARSISTTIMSMAPAARRRQTCRSRAAEPTAAALTPRPTHVGTHCHVIRRGSAGNGSDAFRCRSVRAEQLEGDSLALSRSHRTHRSLPIPHVGTRAVFDVACPRRRMIRRSRVRRARPRKRSTRRAVSHARSTSTERVVCRRVMWPSRARRANRCRTSALLGCSNRRSDPSL